MTNRPKSIATAVRAQRERLAVCEKYSWYIDHAFDFRKRVIEKQLADARKSLETPIPDNYPDEFIPIETRNREALESMASHLEWVQREFNEAHEALKAVGIK